VTAPAATLSATPAARRGRVVENGVFGMALFVLAELMLFSGFISAHIITRRTALPGSWPPPDQPRLPVATTAANSVALLLSGVLLYFAHRAFQRGDRAATQRWMTGSIALGSLFVLVQGVEWARLLAQGLTVSSSLVGAFFYLIVGAHALHAIAALGFLFASWFALRAGRLGNSQFGATQVFWYFVVLLWPLLYVKVYL